jgi:hypothetical protein
MKVDRDAVRRAVVAVAAEDYFGLYEVVWHLRGNYSKSADESELIQAAREIVRSLLADRSARLVRFRMTPPTAWLIDSGDVDHVLEETQSWRPPSSWSEPYPALEAPGLP